MNQQTFTDTLNPRWQAKFELLKKMAGNNEINGSIAKSFLIGVPPKGGQKLGFREILKMTCWPAFVFGFLWYFYQGMWKKALVLLACSLSLSLVIGLLIKDQFSGGNLVAALGYSLFIGLMGTADYYRKLRHNFNGWW